MWLDMKKYLILAGIAATFFACGDDGSSANGGSDEYVTSGTITVDEKNQTAVTVVSNSASLCVYENLKYSWKTMNFGEYRDSIKYEFVGDTLVVYDDYDSYDEEFSPYGQMYVGGSAGKLNGTWHSTLCQYNSERKSTTCRTLCSDIKNVESDWMKAFEELMKAGCVEDEDAPKTTIKISGTSFTTKVEYNESKGHQFDDYMNSEYMYDFYRMLKNESKSTPSIGDLDEEDSVDVKELIEDSVVTILSQTKNSVSFKFKEQSISVKVNEYSRTDEQEKVSLDISYNGTTCSLVGESGYVTKSTCKAEYGEFFDKSTQKDSDGNTFTYAEDYSKTNSRDFSNCMDDLLDSVYAAVRKLKADSDDDDDASLIESSPCDAIYDDYIDCAYQGYSNCSRYLEQFYDCEDSYNSVSPALYTKKAVEESSKEEFVKRYRKHVKKMQKFAE